MRTRVRWLMLGVACLLVTAAAPAVAVPQSPGSRASGEAFSGDDADARWVPHQLLVGFRAGTSAREREEFRERHAARALERFDSIDVELLDVGRADETAFARRAAGDPAVRAVSLNYLRQSVAVPDDELFGSMWGLHNTGQTGGALDADVDAPEAWRLATAASGVVVADIDTGVDIAHPDLAANVWTNPSPAPACIGSPPYSRPCADVNGWDFANDDPTVFDALERTASDFGDLHGTHTAGTAGAVGGNATGVTGVAWATRIMPVKFLRSGFGSDADAIAAIDYARTRGARVINASWGGGGYNQLLKDAIDRAGTAGIVFVAAAGNQARNMDSSPFYPAAYSSPNIISVAATDHKDFLASFSNYGIANVDLAAPGVSTLSTVPRSPAAVVSDGRVVYLAFGAEGLSAAAARESVLRGALAYLGTPAAGTRLLLVDDDAGKGYERFYTPALDALGYAYDAVTVPAGAAAADASTLAQYGAVVWLTGDETASTLVAADRSALDTYLAGGGKLLVSGQNIGYDLDLRNNAPSWFRSTLKAHAIANNSARTTVTGTAAGPFSGLALSLTGGDGAGNQTSPDKVWPVNGGAAALEYPPYGMLNGTSMATPHVTGAVALLRAVRPSATVAEIKSWLFSSVDLLASLSGKVATGGRLNLRRALEMAIADAVPPTVGPATLLAPNGGEHWAGGSLQTVRWDAAAITDPYPAETPISLEYSLDGGIGWAPVAGPLANSGSYEWRVPATDAAQVLVRLTAADELGNAASDSSDGLLTIDSTAPVLGAPTASPDPFSPGSSPGVRDGVTLAADVAESHPDRWVATIAGDAGVVRTESGAGLFVEASWDGRDAAGAVVPDGLYRWTVEQRDRAGHVAWVAGAVTVDSTDPRIGDLTSDRGFFDPSAGEAAAVSFTLSERAGTTLAVADHAGRSIRSIHAALDAGAQTLVWDGRDDAGVPVGVGRYVVEIAAADAAGNTSSAALTLEVIALDVVRKGNWVGAFGSHGYILAAWARGNTGAVDVRSLPSYVSGYSLDAGSRVNWTTSTSDERAPTNATAKRRAAGAYSDASAVKATVVYSAEARGVLSLYLLDWDSFARRESVTVSDADGSRRYPLEAGFHGGVWLRVPVRGTPRVPVSLRIARDGGPTAVVSALMFD